jgi:hypothetical protein
MSHNGSGIGQRVPKRPGAKKFLEMSNIRQFMEHISNMAVRDCQRR